MRNNSPEIEKASCHLARSFYRTMQSTECTLKKWTAFYWKSLPRYPSPQTWKPLNESRQGKIKYRLLNLTPFSVSKRKLMEKKTSPKEFVVLLGNKSLLEGWTRFTQIKTSIRTPKKVLALGDTTWWYSSLPHKTLFFFFFDRNPFNPSCSNRIR